MSCHAMYAQLTQGTLECWVMNGRATNLLLLCMGEYKLKCETGNQSAYIYQVCSHHVLQHTACVCDWACPKMVMS
eukprot:136048-Chlamydomonas_euryale.AAC.1